MSANGTLTQTVLTVAAFTTVSAAQVIGPNPFRKYLLIQNIGSNDLDLGVDATFTGLGSTLSPGGLGKQGGYLIWVENYVPTNAFYASSAAGSTIAILEG